MNGSGGLRTEYSVGVHRDLVDYWLNIQLVCTGIRWITDWIFIGCMNGSGGLPTKYSVGVCRDPADYWLNIQLMCAGIRRITNWIFINWARWIGIEYSDCQLNVQLVCAGILWITDRVFIWCMQGSGRLPIGYLFIGLGGFELNIQLLEWSDQVDQKWIFNIWNDGMKQLNIQQMESSESLN
jgi:hypothetical protein